jgi:hypothetical protein
MKSFYEMMKLIEEDLGLGDQQAPMVAQDQPAPEAAGQEGQETPDQAAAQPSDQEKPKHYMFFSNLKVIKNMAEEMLSMDPSQVDALLDDGHDWASDHVATSKDDVEEVCNWLKSNMEGSNQG